MPGVEVPNIQPQIGQALRVMAIGPYYGFGTGGTVYYMRLESAAGDVQPELFFVMNFQYAYTYDDPRSQAVVWLEDAEGTPQ